MLLALMLSDNALGVAQAEGFPVVRESTNLNNTIRSRRRAWTPRVDSWDGEKTECSAFFQREFEGFGLVRVGAKCEDEEVPYAL